jgi:hypothetical protein
MLAKLYKPTLSLKEEDLPLRSAPCCSLSINPIPQQNAICSATWKWCWQEPSAWCTHKGEVSPVLWRVSSNDVQTLKATNPTELPEYKILFGTRVWVTSASTDSSVARSGRGNGRIGYLWKRVRGMDIEVGTVQSLVGRGWISQSKPRCCYVHGFGCCWGIRDS